MENAFAGVEFYDHQQRERRTLYAGVVVNAAGIWGQRIAEYADLRIAMFPAKGSLLILDHRINRQVINAAANPPMPIFWCPEIPFR